jgi:hypothetical protein
LRLSSSQVIPMLPDEVCKVKSNDASDSCGNKIATIFSVIV